jgi:predicted kinase
LRDAADSIGLLLSTLPRLTPSQFGLILEEADLGLGPNDSLAMTSVNSLLGFGKAMDKKFVDVIEKEIPEGCVLISVGLPGSWKSPVTEEISRMKGFQILRSDLIRLETLQGEDIFDNRVASDPEKRVRVYKEMFKRAEQALRADQRGLILDATFFTQALRREAASLAHQTKRPFVITECVCTEEKSIERILKRTKKDYESNALTREAYWNNKAVFEPVDIGAIKKKFDALPIFHLTIDTESDSPSGWKIRKIEEG